MLVFKVVALELDTLDEVALLMPVEDVLTEESPNLYISSLFPAPQYSY